MDKSVIPNGFYCYGVRVNSKYNNIPYTEDIDFFDYYSLIIVFLHLLSVLICLGGMISIIFVVYYSIQNI